MGSAIGDIFSRPFDSQGRPIAFPGSDRLVAMELADLAHIPHTIGCAVGADKVRAILAAARAGYINTAGDRQFHGPAPARRGRWTTRERFLPA